MTQPAAGSLSSPVDSQAVCRLYDEVRAFSERLCEPLETEDYIVQSMPDVSPTRWHLAHSTWFFETFVLSRYSPNYRSPNDAYSVLFNSYYNAVGEQFPRPRRGVLSRPTVAEVMDYRTHVDEHMRRLLLKPPAEQARELATIVEVGTNHEQQHQELMLTDIKHVFWSNPLLPAYHHSDPISAVLPAPRWHRLDGDIVWIGHDGRTFAYDHERPRHRVLLPPVELANRLVTNAEFGEFIDDGGYNRPELWLSEGWDTRQREDWAAPLYWLRREDAWHEFTLAGLRPVAPNDPVTHVSYFEADAYARWSGAALPTEAAWEFAASEVPLDGQFAEDGRFHPAPAVPKPGADRPLQMMGDAWEWTASPYVAYPGYEPPEGALGEYNGKFMCNQFVLRGGSCVTPRNHIRRTYRSFFPPTARRQFTGIRLMRFI